MDVMSNEQALEVAASYGHKFNVRSGTDIEPGVNCLRCCKPLWMICMERRQDIARERNIAPCKGKPDECVT